MDEIVELLVAHEADVNRVNDLGHSFLCIACENGYTDLAKLFLKNGAHVNVRDHHGNSPLHIVTLKLEDQSTLRSIMKLLITYGADVNIVNEFGHSPLHYACAIGNICISKLLLQNGAD
uniref:Uncharacterized protein n=1 Tax=Capitella teleta TaxID=283909 RepID=X2B4W2_CAPTE